MGRRVNAVVRKRLGKDAVHRPAVSHGRGHSVPVARAAARWKLDRR